MDFLVNHHYTLYAKIKPKVDTSPPYSLYNSPISLHYKPKRRASSVDNFRLARASSSSYQTRRYKGRQELQDFVDSFKQLENWRPNTAQSKLIGNRNYQPPVQAVTRLPLKSEGRKATVAPIPVQPHNDDDDDDDAAIIMRDSRPRRKESRKIVDKIHAADEEDDEILSFKSAVLDAIIARGVFSDEMICDTAQLVLDAWGDESGGRIPREMVQLAAQQLLQEFGISRSLTIAKGAPRKRSGSAGSSLESSSSLSQGDSF